MNVRRLDGFIGKVINSRQFFRIQYCPVSRIACTPSWKRNDPQTAGVAHDHVPGTKQVPEHVSVFQRADTSEAPAVVRPERVREASGLAPPAQVLVQGPPPRLRVACRSSGDDCLETACVARGAPRTGERRYQLDDVGHNKRGVGSREGRQRLLTCVFSPCTYSHA